MKYSELLEKYESLQVENNGLREEIAKLNAKLIKDSLKNPIGSLVTGINEYKVNAVSMANKDGDRIYNDIVEKINSGMDITKAELLIILLIIVERLYIAV